MSYPWFTFNTSARLYTDRATMVSCMHLLCPAQGHLVGGGVSGTSDLASGQLVKVYACVGLHLRTHCVPVSKWRAMQASSCPVHGKECSVTARIFLLVSDYTAEPSTPSLSKLQGFKQRKGSIWKRHGCDREALRLVLGVCFPSVDLQQRSSQVESW